MQLSSRSISLRSLITGITVIGGISIALVIYSQYLTQQDLERNTRRVQLNQYVQQEIATAHLWFEEALGGDTYIDVERDVRDRIRTAKELIDAAINGRMTSLGQIVALPASRATMISLQFKIVELDRLVVDRWAMRDSTGVIGGELDQHFDSVFHDILDLSREVGLQIEAGIMADQKKILTVNVLIIVILLISFCLIAWLVTNNRRELERRAEVLEIMVVERTKALAAREVLGDEKIVKISLVGVGMRSHAGIASRMFEALAREGINIRMISTSEIKISVVIDEKYLELGVRALHDAFDLASPA